MRALMTFVLVAALGCSHRASRAPAREPTPAASGSTAEPTCGGMTGAHHGGDRDGVHGMVLFGRTHYFLEHIPMYAPPHNEQLVMRVSIKSAQGAAVTADFSGQGHSVRPTTRFSLDDLILGKRVTFAANIHRGNFEDGGPEVARGVTITVEQVLVARNLPGNEPPLPADEQEYFVVGEAGDAYATNVVREGRGFQHIVRVDALEGVNASSTCAQRVRVKSARRLATGRELWCLTAPDFTERCE